MRVRSWLSPGHIRTSILSRPYASFSTLMKMAEMLGRMVFKYRVKTVWKTNWVIVRVSAKELTSLILDEERLRSERSDRKLWKSRVTGLDEHAPQAIAGPAQHP